MRLAVALALLLAACAGRAATVRTSQPSDSRGPATVDPAIPAFEMGMMDHVTLAGWSADGAEFGYCTDAMVRRCVFQRLDGTVETLVDRASPDVDAPDAALAAAIDARIAAGAHGSVPGTWPHADAVVLTWAVTPGEPEVRDAVLTAGARLRGSTRGSLSLTLTEPGFDRIHLEYMGLSPDGTRVAVLSHAFLGEYSDTFRVVVSPTQPLVYGAYSHGR